MVGQHTGMDRADALASMAYLVLSARGLTGNPTLNDITLAVVQSAPLLNLDDSSDAPDIEIAATTKLIERHQWTHPTVVGLVRKTTPPRAVG